MSILEAMSVGLLILSTQISGISDISRGGFMFSPSAVYLTGIFSPELKTDVICILLVGILLFINNDVMLIKIVAIAIIMIKLFFHKGIKF